MGILFRHQEDLEHAAKADKSVPKKAPEKSPALPPPPPDMDIADFLGPVLSVDSKPAPEPKPLLAKPAPEAPKREAPAAKPEGLAPVAVAAPVSVARSVTRTDTDVRFSPEEFLKLMRSLPAGDNAPLVVRVVEATLASVKVRMTDLLPEISRRESVLHDRIEAVQKRIEDLEVEVVEQRTELSLLQAELSETTHIKSLLNLTKLPLAGAELKTPGFHRDGSVDETVVLTQPARA